MPKFLRMVRRGGWRIPTRPNPPNIGRQADALADFCTRLNTISVYLADDQDMIDHAIAGLTCKRENLTNFDYAIIDGDFLSLRNLRAVQEPGDTPHPIANDLHHDITDLTAIDVYSLIQSITLKDVVRVYPDGVKKKLLAAIDNHHLSKNDLQDNLVRKLGI